MGGPARHPGLHALAVVGGLLHLFGIPVILLASSPSRLIVFLGVIWFVVGFWFWGWLLSISD